LISPSRRLWLRRSCTVWIWSSASSTLPRRISTFAPASRALPSPSTPAPSMPAHCQNAISAWSSRPIDSSASISIIASSSSVIRARVRPAITRPGSPRW
jgi:hypothetical protein